MTLRPFAVCGVALLLIGCAKSERKPTAHQRQEEAMRDPFRYKPDWSGTDVSGGNMGEIDKEGLKRDLKNVLDP
jgi:hypothetical protein